MSLSIEVEEDYSSQDYDAGDDSDSVWSDFDSGFTESDVFKRHENAEKLVAIWLDALHHSLDPQEYPVEAELLNRAIKGIDGPEKTIILEFYSLGKEAPFSEFRDTGNLIGPVKVSINTEHPVVDKPFQEGSTTAYIDLYNSLILAVIHVLSNPYFQEDRELMYTVLREFLEKSYFVAVGVKLDETATGVIDIENYAELTKIIFPFVGYETSPARIKDFAGNQTFYFQNQDKINFFRFLLDKVPFSVSSRHGYIDQTLEGITIAEADDFLPAPRLQLTRRSMDTDDLGNEYVDKTETMYLDLGDDNRLAIIKAIQTRITPDLGLGFC